MIGPTDALEAMVRQGFTLLLEVRRHPEALRIMPLALAFLETLLRRGAQDGPSLVVSVKALPIRKY
jgi:hypothetical protein